MKRAKENKAIGARLRALRIKRGIRQNFVAAKIGISNNHLSELERGKKRWPAVMVGEYEKVIDCNHVRL